MVYVSCDVLEAMINKTSVRRGAAQCSSVNINFNVSLYIYEWPT